MKLTQYTTYFSYAAALKYFGKTSKIYWLQQHMEIVNHLAMKDVILGCYDINNIPLNYNILVGKCF